MKAHAVVMANKTKTTAATRAVISSCDRAEGPLYTVHGEDSLLYVYDTTIVATTADGRRFMHKTYNVKGWVEGPDGRCANYAAKARTTAFADKVMERGWIDLAHWELMAPPMSLAERWAEEAEVESIERSGNGWRN